MVLFSELLLEFLVLACLSVAAGAAATILNGLLVYVRHHLAGSSRPRADYVTKKSLLLLVLSTLAALLLLTQTKEVPWEWLGTLTLLVAIAPALFTWFGPLHDHVDNCELPAIGKGSAYEHYFGYLRLMEGEHGIRARLEKFKRENPAGLSEREFRLAPEFYSKAVVVLVPKDGMYPDQWDRLNGVGRITATLRPFQCRVGCSQRTYGAFRVHEVVSRDGKNTMYVALDKVGALETLHELHYYGVAVPSDADFQNQMQQLVEELEDIVAENEHLKGQLKFVRYDAGEHVGDAILRTITEDW